MIIFYTNSKLLRDHFFFASMFSAPFEQNGSQLNSIVLFSNIRLCVDGFSKLKVPLFLNLDRLYKSIGIRSLSLKQVI